MEIGFKAATLPQEHTSPEKHGVSLFGELFLCPEMEG